MGTAALSGQSIKRLVAAIIFALIGTYLATIVPSTEIAWVCAILLLTIFLFAFEIVPVDVAAVSIMVLLGLTGLVGSSLGLSKPLVDPSHLFDGFAGNAVISIIAVMIIGAGLDKTGIMGSVASFILRVGGKTEGRIIPIISSTVGFISSFMQNVGAAALFLPVVSRISARTGLPMSRLLMPMGFCAILGGTITMVGSSPLILLNDLIITSNKALPAAKQMETFGLFSVTPIGLALVTTGILYFVLAGRFVLPNRKTEGVAATAAMDYFQDTYGVKYELYEMVVPMGSPLIGMMLDDIEGSEKIRVIAAMRTPDDLRVGPGGLARDVGIEANTVLGVIGAHTALTNFAEKYKLTVRYDLETFTELLAATKAGVGEVVIPPGSTLVGKSARDVWMRKTYGISTLAMHRGGETFREGEGVRDMPLQAGDTLVVHTTWDALARL